MSTTWPQDAERKAIIKALPIRTRIALIAQLTGHLDEDIRLAREQVHGELLLEYLTCHMTPRGLEELIDGVA